MKDTSNPARRAAKRLLLGAADVHQYRPIGLREPQAEVRVWLHGLGEPREVTARNVVVSTRPLTLGIGLESDLQLTTLKRARLSLSFCERQRELRKLGTIDLRASGSLPFADGQLLLFEPLRCENRCVARPWLWARYLYFGYRQWRGRRGSRAPEQQIPASDLHCLFVFYICPRPVVLVSVADGAEANIVPMDLIGSVSKNYFSLALHSTSAAAPLIEHSRRIALSSPPAEYASLAYQLGRNHKEQRIDLDSLPFATRRSAAFGLPVPQFALRIREMEIESVRSVGSYRLFLARVVKDCRLAEGSQFFLVHGFYDRLVAASGLTVASPGS